MRRVVQLRWEIDTEFPNCLSNRLEPEDLAMSVATAIGSVSSRPNSRSQMSDVELEEGVKSWSKS